MKSPQETHKLPMIPVENSCLHYIMPNSWGKLQVLSNPNFKHCLTKYNTFTIPKHLNSRMY